MTVLPEVSKNIKLAMERAGLSEIGLVRATKLPQTTVNQILRGLTKDPRMSTLMLIAETLDITVDQLIGLTPLSKAKQQFAPVLEWNEVLNYLMDEKYPCAYKKWLAIDSDSAQSDMRYFALQTTPSMEPRFRRGSLIIIESTATFRDYQIALVSLNNNEPVLRRIIKDGADFFLKKIHQEYGEQFMKMESSDKILGFVIETRIEEINHQF
ncbi:S24 family peptidase [Glaciimonas sp. GG7]